MSSSSGDAAGARERRRVVVELDVASVVTLLVVAMLGIAGWSIVTSAPDMVTRISVGIVVGVALAPLVSAVDRRWETGRGRASAVVGGGLILLVAGVGLLVGPAAVDQARTFSDELPATVADLYSWPIVGSRLEDADAAHEVARWIEELPASVDDETLGELGERLLGGAFSTVVVLVTAIGVLVDGERIVRRVRALVPPSRQARADEMGQIVYQSFGSYFAGSLLVAVLNGLVILTLGLLLGVPLAPIAGIWSTLTNFIPQIGGFLGGTFFVVLALTESPTTAVIAGVLFLAYQQLENNVISPAIVGSAVNLTPPTTMLAALVGGAAAGVPGALVATPLVGAAKALYLQRLGALPVRREAALRRQLRRRMERLKDKVTDLVE